MQSHYGHSANQTETPSAKAVIPNLDPLSNAQRPQHPNPECQSLKPPTLVQRISPSDMRMGPQALIDSVLDRKSRSAVFSGLKSPLTTPVMPDFVAFEDEERINPADGHDAQ